MAATSDVPPAPPGAQLGGSEGEAPFPPPPVTGTTVADAPGTPGLRRWAAARLRPGTAGRLAAFHALIIATVLGVVTIQLTRAFADRYLATVTSDLTENVDAFSQAAGSRPAGESLAIFTRGFLAAHAGIGGDLFVVTIPSQGVSLGTPGSPALAGIPSVAAALRTPPAHTLLRRVAVPDKDPSTRDLYEVVIAPISAGGRVVGTFVSAGTLTNYLRARSRALELAIGEGGITLLAAAASVYLLLRRLLSSVRRLTRTARDIGLRGELDLRLADERTGDEVGEMAGTFDAMVDKIETAVLMQRQLLADVSHQLRTPLTVMRGHLEVMARGRLDDPAEVRVTTAVVIDQLDHMRRLVEQLLLLGRSLEVNFADLQPVDLRALLADVGDAAAVLGPRDWRIGPVPDVVLDADLDKVRGAVLNLVDNAVKATHPGDVIRISAALPDGVQPAAVDIIVDDSGPGIPAAEREAVLARFARSWTTETRGTGLGLAIVEAVARAHGGRTLVGESPLGGARIVMRLALSPRGGTNEPLDGP